MGRRAAAVIVEIIQLEIIVDVIQVEAGDDGDGDAPAHGPHRRAALGRHPIGVGGEHSHDGRSPRGGAGGAPRQRGQPRRPGIVLAGLASVVAMIAVVALVAGGSDDHRTRAPTPPVIPATRPTTPTVAVPSTVATSVEPAGSDPTGNDPTGNQPTGNDPSAGGGRPVADLYLPNLPAAYQVQSADQTYPYRAVPATGIQQLWSDGRTSTLAPRWLRIDAGTAADIGEPWGSARLTTDRGIAVVSRNPFDGLTVTGPIAGGRATVTTSGLTLAEVVTALDGAVFAADTLRFGDSALPIGFRMVATSEVSEGAPGARERPFDLATMTLSYQSAADPSRWLSVYSTASETPLDQVWDDYTVPVRRDVTVGDGRTATVRSVPSAGSASWSWVDVALDGVMFRISGTAPIDDALTMARTLHRVGSERWEPLQELAGRNRNTHPVLWYTGYHDIASGTSATGRGWSVMSARGARVQPDTYLVQIGGGGASLDQVDAAGIQAVADSTTTVIIGTAPRDHPGAVLHVSVGGTQLEAPLTDPGDGSGVLVGVVAFTDVGLPVAEVVDPDGTVVTSGPSLSN